MTSIIKVDQPVFIQDLVIETRPTNCNTNVISMKANSSIDMSDLENYKEVNLYTYQCLIGKLIYFTYSIRPNIAFVVGQLSRYNANPRKRHL